MSTMFYTEEHEWLRDEGDGTATVGITDFAQKELGDLVFVELPEIGKSIAKGAEAAALESVKAASDLYLPVAGTVVAVNDVIVEDPAKINDDPLGDGWFFKIKVSDPAELKGLMDQAAYEAFVKSLG